MAMDEDDELLQDFLVEAGEILEQLGEQLVDLENRPQDKDLLNAVFRGFHTIKGGASFLNLESLVAICHRSEDVFNVLRNGERRVDAKLMDVILPVLDILNEMFDDIRSGKEPRAADSQLLAKLEELTAPQSAASSAEDPVVVTAPGQLPAANPAGEITEDEYTALINTLEDNDPSVIEQNQQQQPVDDEISEDEFEALLDQLQDVRGGQAKAADVQSQESKPVDLKPSSVAEAQAQGDEISEEEFEALLDQLHGPGKAVKAASSKPAANIKPTAGRSVTDRANKGSAASQNTAAGSEVNSEHNSTSPVLDLSAKTKDNASQNEPTVRVDTKRLDDIMNLVGELVLVRNRMATLELASNDEEMSKVVANLDVVTADLQSAVMKTRMQPIKKVFGRFPRVVRDLARSLKKEVNLELQGEDTDLDKNLVEALADPLVHLVRNAVDHGIETPEEREANGKPRTGTVILTAEQEGDHILLTIEDDGKGMDPEKLRQTAVKKGLMDEEAAARLDDKECYNLIFQPGFSTKTEISDVSGRGVGMDVVKTRIVQLNGSVEIDSTPGRGSVIIIKVPLTLAIMPTLMVMLESQIFALPLASVNEIFNLDLTKTNVVDGQLVVLIRDKALPLFYLRHWLVKGARHQNLPAQGHVVVVSMGIQRIGFVVDQLIGQEEVVIKPLGALLHGMKGLAGATITGDGRISLILDIPGLMQTYARRL